MTSLRPLSRGLAWLGLACLLALAACHGNGSGPSMPSCAQPLRGQRYAVCGHLTTAPLAAAGLSGRQIQGSVDSATPRATGGYEISGGTFHANH